MIKGNFAESIIHKYVESKGYVLYEPTTKGAHAFDGLAIRSKQQLLIIEIKAKAKLNNYNETGIEYRHYTEYKNISEKHKIRVFIFFVDEMLEEIYGNFLDILESNSRIAPWSNGKQILFSMESMIRGIHYLNNDEVKFLKENSTRNYEYKKKIGG